MKKFFKRILKGSGTDKPHLKLLHKAENNPIIAPNEKNEWEAWQTFNPATIFLEDKIHFIYRAIGFDGISRFGYAASQDGFKISERLNYPIYQHYLAGANFEIKFFSSGGSLGGCEDPRIVRVDKEDRIYMVYTALSNDIRVALTSIKIKDFLNKSWHWTEPRLISPPGQTHKNWVIFPEKIRNRYAILTSITPKILISYRETLSFKKGGYLESFYQQVEIKNSWELYRRGAGPPPLKTKEGWLLFYHAIAKNNPSIYKVGAMILDYKNPENILVVSKQPILEPEEVYEKNGFKSGVVYASGAVIKNNILLLYYGAADSYVAVAYADLDQFLKEIKVGKKPKIFKKILLKKRINDFIKI